jgi:hypothetical protein
MPHFFRRKILDVIGFVATVFASQLSALNPEYNLATLAPIYQIMEHVRVTR